MTIKQVFVKDLGDDSDEKLAALQNEIDCIKDADHPNIVKFYATQATKSKLNIFSEYCLGGQSLRNLFPFNECLVSR